jgi:hypothetical protein
MIDEIDTSIGWLSPSELDSGAWNYAKNNHNENNNNNYNHNENNNNNNNNNNSDNTIDSVYDKQVEFNHKDNLDFLLSAAMEHINKSSDINKDINQEYLLKCILNRLIHPDTINACIQDVLNMK